VILYNLVQCVNSIYDRFDRHDWSRFKFALESCKHHVAIKSMILLCPSDQQSFGQYFYVDLVKAISCKCVILVIWFTHCTEQF